MGMFKKMKEDWSKMTLGEKVGTVLGCACDFGCGFLSTVVTNHFLPAETKKWQRLLCNVAAYGIGMDLSERATRQYKNMIDDISSAFKKAEESEEDAHAGE